MSAAVYGASTVKRRTRAELDAVDDAIIDAVEADKPVTLRGVYYRVVSAGAVEKTEDGCRLVGRELVKLRRAGRVSYADITDGTRWIKKPRSWDDLEQMLDDAAASYRRALWHDQDVEVMVFSEKDAITGVVFPVTSQWDVPLGVLRGYASESFCWTVAQSIAEAPGAVYVYQLGDHDPSGIGAWDDFAKKVTGFAGGAATFQDGTPALFFERIAVTPGQITEMGLPTRPTKRTDPRSAGFAGASVEVDAIPAPVLRQIIEGAITQHIDQHQLEITQVYERSERETLSAWADVAARRDEDGS